MDVMHVIRDKPYGDLWWIFLSGRKSTHKCSGVGMSLGEQKNGQHRLTVTHGQETVRDVPIRETTSISDPKV